MNNRLVISICIIFFLFTTPSLSQIKNDSKPLFGLISAMPSESKAILSSVKNKKTVTNNGISYTEGELSGKNVIVVTTGIGKINAANVTSRLIADYHPNYVIFAGIAGAINPNLTLGDIVIGEKIYNAEHLSYKGKTDSDDINSINNKITPYVIAADKNLLNTIKNHIHITKYHLIYGLIGTTDTFPQTTQQLLEIQKKKVDALEMEGFAAMQICWLYNTPCLIVRGISDCPLAGLQKNNDTNHHYKIPINGKILAEKNISLFVNELLLSI